MSNLGDDGSGWRRVYPTGNSGHPLTPRLNRKFAERANKRSRLETSQKAVNVTGDWSTVSNAGSASTPVASSDGKQRRWLLCDTKKYPVSLE
jgi:hypothetical protein